jgi:sulfur carrier protein
MSPRVSVNGSDHELASGATVATVVVELGVPGGGRGVAVAVDGEVVPRGEWAGSVLRDGARVEVVVAVQGG